MGLEMVTPITVLCACYQGEKWLPEQLDTLAGQDDPCFSVLLQDDGSSDATPSLLREVCGRDPRFRMAAENGRHFGAAGNFLSLMRQAPEGWCALCDQDDLWQPDRLSACRQAMEEAEERWGAGTPLLVHSDCRVLAEDGSELYPGFFAHQGWDGAATGLNRLLVQNNVTGCTTLLNAPLRRLVAEHGDAEKIFMHDWLIAQTAAAFGHIVFVPRPLVGYRQHGTNAVGASKTGLAKRALQALSMPEKARARMVLNYRQARALRDCYGTLLPAASAEAVDRFLATAELPKLRRLRALRRGGYLMQSRTLRVGQMIFG